VQQGIICVLLTLSLKTDKGQTMKTLDCNEIQNLMRKAKTLEQFHALGLLYVQTLKEKYKGETYTCYKPKGQSWNKGF
jgi:hypothetical protein